MLRFRQKNHITVVLMVKKLPAKVGDTRDPDLIPGSDGSPEGGNGNPFQYSCREIPWTEESAGLKSTELQRVRNA